MEYNEQSEMGWALPRSPHTRRFPLPLPSPSSQPLPTADTMPIYTSATVPQLPPNVIDLAKDDLPTTQPLTIIDPPISLITMSPSISACTACAQCSNSPCCCATTKDASATSPSPTATVVGELDGDEFAKAPVDPLPPQEASVPTAANSNDAASRRWTQGALQSVKSQQPSPQIAAVPSLHDSRRKPRSFSSDSQSSLRPHLYSPISSTYHVTPPASPTSLSGSSSANSSKALLASPCSPPPSSASSSSLVAHHNSNPDQDSLDPYVDITRLRIRSRGTECLYPGAVFSGTQKSGRNTYDVTVTIVDVDMDSSFLCGYLKICGLIDTWPEITTYFDAEIIGERYGFLTQDWGASESEDMTHWGRFPAFRHVKNEMKRPMLTVKDSHREKKGVVFMRWKERFLVPDHRVKDIDGASFAGFYYVCVDFNNASSRGSPSSSPTYGSFPGGNRSMEDSDCDRSSRGNGFGPVAAMTGFYYHQNSEPYQQLSLSHTPENTMSHFEVQ